MPKNGPRFSGPHGRGSEAPRATFLAPLAPSGGEGVGVRGDGLGPGDDITPRNILAPLSPTGGRGVGPVRCATKAIAAALPGAMMAAQHFPVAEFARIPLLAREGRAEFRRIPLRMLPRVHPAAQHPPEARISGRTATAPAARL